MKISFCQSNFGITLGLPFYAKWLEQSWSHRKEEMNSPRSKKNHELPLRNPLDYGKTKGIFTFLQKFMRGHVNIDFLLIFECSNAPEEVKNWSAHKLTR